METEVAEEPRSFEVFLASEHARLLGALCLVTGDRSEAEEIMQDAFLRLWERWDHVAEVDDPSPYLFRTAMNVFRNRYRRAALALRKTISVAPTEDIAIDDGPDNLSHKDLLHTGVEIVDSLAFSSPS
ncbi:MAG: RNA polymerase sigma factor [Actinomycetota bacterium]